MKEYNDIKEKYNLDNYFSYKIDRTEFGYIIIVRDTENSDSKYFLINNNYELIRLG